MAGAVDLVLLWHMHQPCYRGPGERAPRLPFVRLHAIRGYTDMVDALERHDRVRACLNWVPVLLDQLGALVAGEEDRWLLRVRAAMGGICRDEARRLLHDLRSALAPPMAVEFRRWCPDALDEALSGDGRLEAGSGEHGLLLDALVAFHLAWSGARVRRSPVVEELQSRDGGFCVGDLQALLEVHREEVESLLPRLRALIATGRVELSTTPYHHPILPLLGSLDSNDYRTLDGEPAFSFAWPDDAEDHVLRALEHHRQHFGASPAGMWPAEGAIDGPTLDRFARSGLGWVASDDQVLQNSLAPNDVHDHQRYRPWRWRHGERSLTVLFRDHDLSDRIGFRYLSMEPEAATADFLERLQEIANDSPWERPTVLVALDGENPWEQDSEAGRPFLDTFYAALADADFVNLATPQEVVADPPELGELDRVVGGSWIDGTFATWTGHPEKMRAWRLLAEVRGVTHPQPLDTLPDELADSLRVLQSSDWFWWLGEDHPTPFASAFDDLFRAHLRRAWEHSGADPRSDDDWVLRQPREVLVPDHFERDAAPAPRVGAPAVDCCHGHFTWVRAGGSMSEGKSRRRLYFGVSTESAGAPRFTLWWDPAERDEGGIPELTCEASSGDLALRAQSARGTGTGVLFVAELPADWERHDLSFVLSNRVTRERWPRHGSAVIPIAVDEARTEKSGPASPKTGNSQLRRDPLEGNWVVFAPDRAGRPRTVPVTTPARASTSVDCPFCPGNEYETCADIDAIRDEHGAWRVRAFANRFPMLSTDVEWEQRGDGLGDQLAGVGAHELVVETRDHDRALADFEPDEFAVAIGLWRRRIADLYQDGRLRQAVVFRNEGALAGASVAHAHSQIAALPRIPARLGRKLERSRDHYRRTERCLLCDLLRRTREEGTRVVREVGGWLTFTPWASVARYEMCITKTEHSSSFLRLGPDDDQQLAAAIVDAARRLRRSLNGPATNLFITLEPNVHAEDWPGAHWDSLERDFHWHVSVLPRLAAPAGFEWGTEWCVNSTLPERAAAELRDAGD